MYKTTEKADLKGINGDYNWSDSMENFENDFALDTKFGSKQLTGGINFQQKQTSVTTYYPSINTIYRDRGSLWNIYFLNTYINYRFDFKENININNRLYYRNVTVKDNSVREVVDTAQIGYFRPGNIMGFESTINHTKSNKLFINGGFVFETEELSEDYSVTYSNSPLVRPPAPGEPPRKRDYLVSIYTQAQYKLNTPFQLIVGARYDLSSYYDQVFTPRLGLLYSVNKIGIKALYMTAFRAPKPWDYTNGLGNTALIPEKMRSSEIAINYSVYYNLMLNISIYNNYLHNALTIENVLTNYRWVNKGAIRTNGFELQLNQQIDNQTISMNYTFNQSLDENNVVISEIAKHSFNLEYNFPVQKFVEVSFRINYLGKRKNPQFITQTQSNYIKEALIFNSVISIPAFKNMNMSLVVKNLFNETYYHSSNRLPERYRQPQRTIYLKIGYTFSDKK
jgi:outer membrane cobalamin receptor